MKTEKSQRAAPCPKRRRQLKQCADRLDNAILARKFVGHSAKRVLGNDDAGMVRAP
jgi:hypothetical protein